MRLFLFILLIIGIVMFFIYFTKLRNLDINDPKQLDTILGISSVISKAKKPFNKSYNYLLSIFSKTTDIPVDFIHKFDPSTQTYPYNGGAVIDIYNDGDEYIFVGGGQDQDDALLLYENGKLINKIQDTNLSSKSATYGAVSLDLDKDGFSDLIVARENGVTLYKNNKNGMFQKRIILPKQEKTIPIGLAISDYDKDGNVDIYISQFMNKKNFVPNKPNALQHHAKNVLLKGDDNLQFIDVTKKTASGGKWNTFTGAFIDLDNDTYPDLVLASDAGRVEILKNNKTNFKNMDNPSGIGYWMGIASGDYDADGDEDLFLTNLGNTVTLKDIGRGDLHKNQYKDQNINHILLRNDGNFKFTDVTEKENLINHGFGWGAIFDDIDLDGYLDLLFSQNSYFIPTQHINPDSGAVFLNKKGSFEKTKLFPNKHFSMSPINVDFNKDGINDYVWININGPTKAYINPHRKNNYINVKMPDNLDFANANVKVYIGDKILQRQNIIGGIGFASDMSSTLTFGLGSHRKVDKVVIKTIYGKKYTHMNPKINTTLMLKHPPAFK